MLLLTYVDLRAHTTQAQPYFKSVLSHTASLHQPTQVVARNSSSVNNEDATTTQFGPLKELSDSCFEGQHSHTYHL